MKAWKVFLIIGILVLLIGIALLITGLALNDWKFGTSYKTEHYTSQTNVTALDLSVSAGEMNVTFHDGDKIEVDYPTGSAINAGYTVYEDNGKLTVKQKRSFIFNWFGNRNIPPVNIKIPRSMVLNVKLDMSAGKMSVESGMFALFDLDVSAGKADIGAIGCQRCEVDISAGTVNFAEVKTGYTSLDLSAGSVTIGRLASDKISVDVSAGSANMKVQGNPEEYTVLVDKSAGSCNVSSRQGSNPNKQIDIDISAGSVTVTFTPPSA